MSASSPSFGRVYIEKICGLSRPSSSDATLAIIPAGTANLLATNLGIPKDVAAAVDVGLGGHTRAIDVGRLNGECFAVMAGAGFDARMIGDADGSLKDRVGRLAYVWTGAKHMREKQFRAKIKVDGARWYDGDARCIMLGNVGKLFGGGPGSWVRMQGEYDVWHAERNVDVSKIPTLKAA